MGEVLRLVVVYSGLSSYNTFDGGLL